MIAVFIRIALRYSAGMLVARGLLGADDASAFSADPDRWRWRPVSALSSPAWPSGGICSRAGSVGSTDHGKSAESARRQD